MKRILFSIFLLLAIGIFCHAAAQKCLDYDSTVTLNGKLHSRVFPGRPNYESIRKGDEKETALLLRLAKKICTDGHDSDILSLPEKNISIVQLVLSRKEHWRIVRKRAGKRTIVTGTLFHAHTGHHHAKVLLQASSIKAPK